jgi:predicted RNA-binding protein
MEQFADSVLIVRQEGADVVLRGLLVEPRRVIGTIHEIDSLKHSITLREEQPPGPGPQVTPTPGATRQGVT